MINVDTSLLSNIFTNKKFKIDTLKHHFEDDAWLLVLDVVDFLLLLIKFSNKWQD